MSKSSHRYRSNISIDGWAVLLSLGLALVVRLGLIKTVPW